MNEIESDCFVLNAIFETLLCDYIRKLALHVKKIIPTLITVVTYQY